jgi:hypothetical protein
MLRVPSYETVVWAKLRQSFDTIGTKLIPVEGGAIRVPNLVLKKNKTMGRGTTIVPMEGTTAFTFIADEDDAVEILSRPEKTYAVLLKDRQLKMAKIVGPKSISGHLTGNNYGGMNRAFWFTLVSEFQIIQALQCKFFPPADTLKYVRNPNAEGEYTIRTIPLEEYQLRDERIELNSTLGTYKIADQSAMGMSFLLYEEAEQWLQAPIDPGATQIVRTKGAGKKYSQKEVPTLNGRKISLTCNGLDTLESKRRSHTLRATEENIARCGDLGVPFIEDSISEASRRITEIAKKSSTAFPTGSGSLVLIQFTGIMAVQLLREYYPDLSDKKGRNGICYNTVDLSEFFSDEPKVKIYHGIEDSGYAQVIMEELQKPRSGGLVQKGVLNFLPFAMAFYRRRPPERYLPSEAKIISAMLKWSLRETLRQVMGWHNGADNRLTRVSHGEAMTGFFDHCKWNIERRGIPQERHPSIFHNLSEMQRLVKGEWEYTADILDTFVNKQTCPSTGLIRSAFGEQPEGKSQ